MADTVLITGGSGFIGLELARNLIADDHKVVIFDLKKPEDLLHGSKAASYVRGDISSLPQVLSAVRDFRPDAIIHLAALLSEPSEKNPWASVSVNAFGQKSGHRWSTSSARLLAQYDSLDVCFPNTEISTCFNVEIVGALKRAFTK